MSRTSRQEARGRDSRPRCHPDPGVLAKPKPWLEASSLSGRPGSQALQIWPKVPAWFTFPPPMFGQPQRICVRPLPCSPTFHGSPLPTASPLKPGPDFSSFTLCIKDSGLAKSLPLSLFCPRHWLTLFPYRIALPSPIQPGQWCKWVKWSMPPALKWQLLLRQSLQAYVALYSWIFLVW